MDTKPLSWSELEALKKRLNHEVVARRQSVFGTPEDRAASTLFGGRVRTFVDAKGRPIN